MGQFGYNWTSDFQSRCQKYESHKPKDHSSNAWAKWDQYLIKDVKSIKVTDTRTLRAKLGQNGYKYLIEDVKSLNVTDPRTLQKKLGQNGTSI